MPELIELEQQLSRLGAALEWPATPNLTPVVRLKIATSPPRFDSRWAIAAAAILAVASLIAYAPSRDAIAGWINVHTFFRTVPHLATPTPLPPGPLGRRLGLGSPTTLSQARAALEWSVLVPASLGPPDEVYLQPPSDAPSGGEVTLVYADRSGLPAAGETGVGVLLTEARGSLNSNYFGKTIGPGTTIQQVSVDGSSGYWIAGAPHIFGFTDSAGDVRFETLRLATNTLLLDIGGSVVRIEGNLTKDQALAIAATLA